MKEKNNKSKNNKLLTKDILQIRYFDEEADAFVNSDGSFFNFFEVISKDRPNMQDDELQYDILTLAKFYKLYQYDLKWITLNFPINTVKQRIAKKKILDRTNDPVRRKWLQRHIAEMNLIDKNTMKREYYLMFFGSNREEYIKNANNILNYIGSGRMKLVQEISKEKRIYILKKLNNMSSLLVIEEGDYEDI